jgi:hypothetical protein
MTLEIDTRTGVSRGSYMGIFVREYVSTIVGSRVRKSGGGRVSGRGAPKA